MNNKRTKINAAPSTIDNRIELLNKNYYILFRDITIGMVGLVLRYFSS